MLAAVAVEPQLETGRGHLRWTERTWGAVVEDPSVLDKAVLRMAVMTGSPLLEKKTKNNIVHGT